MVLVRLFWRQVPTAYSPVLVSDDNSRHFSAPLMTVNLVSISTLPLHALMHSLHTHALASHSPPHIQCVFWFPWLFNDYCCFKIVVWCYYEMNNMLIECVFFLWTIYEWLGTWICVLETWNTPKNTEEFPRSKCWTVFFFFFLCSFSN